MNIDQEIYMELNTQFSQVRGGALYTPVSPDQFQKVRNRLVELYPNEGFSSNATCGRCVFAIMERFQKYYDKTYGKGQA